MHFDAAQHRSFAARLDCRYVLCVPARVPQPPILVVALHGFGQDPETFLPLSANLVGEHTIAALAGPYQFFTRQKPPEVGYGWITSRHSESSIRLHHDMVLHVLNEAGREFDIPPERRILLGFSQSVALNYRFAATYPDALGGVIGVCGGTPSDWDTNPRFRLVTAALLHIARREDEFYPAAKAETYPEILSRRAADVEFHMLEGGHRMPSKAGRIVKQWMDRVLEKRANSAPAIHARESRTGNSFSTRRES